MNRPARRFYEFGEFRIDADERQLLHLGSPVGLTPKVFDLLLLLVENRGHTVEKSEIMQRIWPDSYVNENSLNRNISLLRKALVSTPDADGYIRTVPTRGYRFEADVRQVVENEEELVLEKRTNYSLSFQNQRHHTGSPYNPRRLVGIVAIAIVVTAVAVWVVNRSSDDDRSRASVVKPTPDPEAMELYRRGRELWQNRSAAGLHESTQLLEQAVEKDPNFALAYAALADAYAFDTRNWRKTEGTAELSIRLDPTLGEPHASVGFVKFFWEWKPADAEVRLKKAVELSPNYAVAHQWYGIILAAVGQFNPALAEMQRALELEPNSVAVNADMCQMLYFVRRFDEAEAQCKKTLEIDPNSFSALSNLYYVYLAEDKQAEAIETFFARERLAVNNESLPADHTELRAAFDRGGIREFLQMQIRLRGRIKPAPGYPAARYHALLGESDAAISSLERAMANHEFEFVYVFADPVLRDLMSDQRYSEMATDFIYQRANRPVD